MSWLKIKDLENIADAVLAFCLAGAAALAIKIPAFFGIPITTETGFYARNLSLLVLPFLTVYFIRTIFTLTESRQITSLRYP